MRGDRRVWAVLAGMLALVSSTTPLRSAEAPPAVFGPVDAVRNTVAVVPKTWTFTVASLDPAGYVMCIENGGHSGQFARATAQVTLNDVSIFAPADFAGPVTLSRAVTLSASNRLSVEIRSKAKTGLTLAIRRGPSCTATAPVNRPPVFTSTPVTSATLLEPYTYPAVAADPDGDVVSYALVTSPLGMTINPATGAVSWLPPGTGTLNVAIRATDTKGAGVTQSFAVVVGRSANRPPHITTIANRRVPAGVPFRLELHAEDPDPGDVVTFVLDGAPAGASIVNGHAVQWTPGLSDLGTHTFSVRARDAAGAADTASFTVEVVASDGAPVLDPIDDGATTAGTAFLRTITASDPNPGDVLAFSKVAGPAGLAVAPTGELSWTPASAQLGDHRVTVMVTDSHGLADVAVFTVSVGVPPVPQPPVARDDRFAVRRGTTLSVAPPGVLSNDDDPNGLPLSAQLVTTTSRGALALGADGGFTYTPTPALPSGTAPSLAFTHGFSTYNATYAQPLVVDLDRDGRPEIVYFAAGAFAQRRLIAVHGNGGSTAWMTNAYDPAGTPPVMICLNCELSAADLDADGRPEILAIHSDNETTHLRRRIIAFNSDGSHRWTSDDVVDGVNVVSTAGMFETAVADLDVGSPGTELEFAL